MLLALLAWVAPAAAQRPAPPQRQRLEHLEREIGQLKRLIASYQGAQSTILGEIQQLDHRLALARHELEAAEARLAIGRSRERSLARNAEQLEQQARQAAALLRRALVRLYTQGTPDWVLVALGASDPAEFRSGLRYLQQLSREEAEALESYRELRARSLEQREQAARAVEELEDLTRDLEHKQQSARVALETKNARLDSISLKRAQSQRAVEELESAAAQLRGLFQELPRPAQPAPQTPVVPFASLRGGLPWPAVGEVTRGFGTIYHPRFHTAIEHTGLTIAADAGQPVRAVHAGSVVFADWFKGYGLLVILDHADGYYTLYAHLAELSVSKGQAVASGELLGLVGDTGSLEGAQLYFEIRRGSSPQNPARWLSRRRAGATPG